MSSVPTQFVCKACGKSLSPQTIAAARRGYAARCACGASVRDTATPARVTAAEPTYDVASASPASAKTNGSTKATKAAAKPVVVPGLEEDSYRCPSCNSVMAPGTVICICCGFNLNTGQHLAGSKKAKPAATTKPSASARRAGSAFGVPRPAGLPKVTEDRTGQLNQVLLAVAGMILLLAIVMGGRFLWGHFHPVVNYVGDDGKVADLTDNSGATEIHTWFNEDSSRMAGGYSSNQAIAFADRLQKMGAKQILVFGSRMTRSMAVELPDDPAQRKGLIDWYNENELAPGSLPEKEEHQHYLLVTLPL